MIGLVICCVRFRLIMIMRASKQVQIVMTETQMLDMLDVMLCVLFLSPVKLKSSLVCCGEKILIRISSIAETEIKRDFGAAPSLNFLWKQIL